MQIVQKINLYIFVALLQPHNLLPSTEPPICKIITEGDEAVWDDEENTWSLK